MTPGGRIVDLPVLDGKAGRLDHAERLRRIVPAVEEALAVHRGREFARRAAEGDEQAAAGAKPAVEAGEEGRVLAPADVEDGVPRHQGIERPIRLSGPHVTLNEGRARDRAPRQVEEPGRSIETRDTEAAIDEVRRDRDTAPTAHVENPAPGREGPQEEIEKRLLPKASLGALSAVPTPRLGDPVVAGGDIHFGGHEGMASAWTIRRRPVRSPRAPPAPP